METYTLADKIKYYEKRIRDLKEAMERTITGFDMDSTDSEVIVAEVLERELKRCEKRLDALKAPTYQDWRSTVNIPGKRR